jgi:Spy/CpxP family protein refolding chaperone
MKPWIKRSLWAAGGVALLATAFTAGAVRGHAGWGWHSTAPEDLARMKAHLVDRAAKKLDLNDAQKAKLATLADQVQAQRSAWMAGQTDPRAEMTALLQGNSFDRQRAQAWVDGKAAVVKTGSPALIAAFGDFYDSLQPAQQQQLRTLLQRRGGHHGEHGDRAHGSHEHGRG